MNKFICKVIRFLFFFAVQTASPLFGQVSAGDDKATCDGSVTLYGIPSGGVWSTTSGAVIHTPSSSNTFVSSLDPGVNEFTYTVNGLGSDLVVVANNTVYADAGENRLSSCLTTANLTASSIPTGGTGNWTLKYPAPGIIIEHPTANNTQVSNLPFGNTIFIWTVEANGCSAVDEVLINCNTPENNTGSDVSGCSNVFYIGVQQPPAGGTGLWTQIEGTGSIVFSSPNSSEVQITAPIGVSKIRWTLSYGTCTSTRDILVTNNLPTVFAGIDKQLCSNEVDLSADPLPFGVSGKWTVIDPKGEVFSDIHVHNPKVSNLKRGLTTFVWEVDNGLCKRTDSVGITNNLPRVDAGRDTAICSHLYSLIADMPEVGIGTWSCNNPEVVIHQPHSHNSAVSNLKNGAYTFRWSVSNSNCTASDEVNITSRYLAISAGTNSAGCQDNATFIGTAIPGGSTGLWTVIDGEGVIDNPSTNSIAVSNIKKSIRLKWTISSSSCVYSSQVEYFNQLPTQATTQNDFSVCENTIRISANPPSANDLESGLWTLESIPGSIIISEKSLFQTDVLNLGPGIHSFRWTISNPNCSTSDVLQVTNKKIQTNAGPDQSICGQSTFLNAEHAGGTGFWTVIGGSAILANSTQPNTEVTGLDFGSTIFRWTRYDNDCYATDDVIVTNNKPLGVFAGPDQTVCAFNTTLGGNLPVFGTGKWTVMEGTADILNSLNPLTEVSALSKGTNIFRWTIQYANCSEFDDVHIYNRYIDGDAGADQSICNTSTALLNGSVPDAGQTGIWSVQGGTGVFSSISSHSTQVSSLNKGFNTFRWTISDPYCSNFDQVSIINNTPDLAEVAGNQIICTSTAQLDAVAVSIGTGSWSITSGGGLLSNSLSNKTQVSGIPTGNNVYTWTVTRNGCSLSASQTITNRMVNASIAEDLIEVCRQGNDTVISAHAATGDGNWGIWSKLTSGSGEIVSPTNHITTVRNLQIGESNFRWTVQNENCQAWDDVRVKNNYIPAKAEPIDTTHICADFTTLLSNQGPSGSSMFWSSQNPLIEFSDSSNTNVVVSKLPRGKTEIFWNIRNNGCHSIKSIELFNQSFDLNAGDTMHLCGYSAVLDAPVLPVGQTGVWTVNNQSLLFDNPNSPTSAISNVPIGISVLTWTVSDQNCTASALKIIHNNYFAVSAGNSVQVCANTYTLEGSDPLTGSGKWTVIAGNAVLANPTNKVSPVSKLQFGENTFRWTVANKGCIASSDVTITNDLYLADVLPLSDLCSDSAEISAVQFPENIGLSGQWSIVLGGGIFEHPTNYKTLVRNIQRGENQFRWTVSKNGCTTSKILGFSNHTFSVSAGVDLSICDSFTSIFASPLSPTGKGNWTGPGSVVISSPNTPNTFVSELSRGSNQFIWTVEDNSCKASDTLLITNNLFDVQAGTDQLVSVPAANLNATLPFENAIGKWQVVAGNGVFSNSSSPATLVEQLSVGLNQFRWQVERNNCAAYDDVVVFYSLAMSQAGYDQASCLNSAKMTAEIPEYGSGTWSIVQGGGLFENINNPKSMVTNIPMGTNIYRWTVRFMDIEQSDDVSITNKSFLIGAGPDKTTCDDFIDLQGEDPGDGTAFWYILSGSGTIANNFDPKSRVSGLFIGTSRFVYEVQRNGCLATDTVAVLRYQPPTTPNGGPDVTLCNTNQHFLMGNIPTSGTGLWTTDNSEVLLSTPSFVNTQVFNLKDGKNNFWWTIRTPNCQLSDQVVVSTYKTLKITDQPVSKTLTVGGSHVFTFKTEGGVKSYQWKKEGFDLTDNDRIKGTQTDSLVISNLAYTDMGVYYCVVQGFCNNVTTTHVSLSVVTSLEPINTNAIRVYPNPSSGLVKLDFEKFEKNSVIYFTSLDGRILLRKETVKPNMQLDLMHLPDGTYLIMVQSDKNIFRSKIVLKK
jgi:large repetitive protein